MIRFTLNALLGLAWCVLVISATSFLVFAGSMMRNDPKGLSPAATIALADGCREAHNADGNAGAYCGRAVGALAELERGGQVVCRDTHLHGCAILQREWRTPTPDPHEPPPDSRTALSRK